MKTNLRIALRFAACAAVMLAVSAPVLAATKITMAVSGGGLTGEPMPVVSVTHTKKIPSSLTMQKRSEGVLTVMRQVDTFSPKLNQAAIRKEALREITFRFLGGAVSGSGKAVETIVISDPVITQIREDGKRESITFSYKTITVKNTDGSKAMADDWNAQE
jgi:type VI secretion system Hcp family effector